MLNVHFVIVGAIINLIGSSSYVIHTLQGKARPNRVTWFMWAFAPLVAFSAELSQGVGLQSLMTFMVGFGPLLVVIASFIGKGKWQIVRFDLACGGLSFLGLLLWLLTREGNIAIAFSILSDGLAATPTVIKSYHSPESESWGVFLGGALNAIITLLTIQHWTIASAGFPTYILIICSILFLLIRLKLGKRFKVASAKAAS